MDRIVSYTWRVYVSSIFAMPVKVETLTKCKASLPWIPLDRVFSPDVIGDTKTNAESDFYHTRSMP